MTARISRKCRVQFVGEGVRWRRETQRKLLVVRPIVSDDLGVKAQGERRPRGRTDRVGEVR